VFEASIGARAIVGNLIVMVSEMQPDSAPPSPRPVAFAHFTFVSHERPPAPASRLQIDDDAGAWPGTADEHVTGIGLVGDVQKIFDIAVDKPRHAIAK
jgi:hypothetical protein